MSNNDVIFWLVMLAVMIFLWWFGFFATKRMRLEKNAMREEQARKNLQAQALEKREAEAADGKVQ